MEFSAGSPASPVLPGAEAPPSPAAWSLSASPLLDPLYYAARCGLRFATAEDAAAHYVTTGWRAGLDPHPLFDTRWYLQRYPDVAGTGADPLSHYLLIGAREGRSPNPLFLPDWYRTHAPEAAQMPVDPLVHYALAGGALGYDPCPLFDTGWYAAANPDAAASGLTPLGHYLHVGSRRGATPHPLFDPVWYRESNGDVAASGLDPVVHYLHWGRNEGRAPNAFFDPAWYLDSYPDVRGAGVDPLWHFREHGWREGRDPSPRFCTRWYLDSYPDAAATGDNPLIHHLRIGQAEGRPAYPGDPAGLRPLTPDFALGDIVFDRWRAAAFASAGAAAGKRLPLSPPPRLLVVVAAGDAAEAARLPASLAALSSGAALAGLADWLVFDATGAAAMGRLAADVAVCTGVEALAARLDACGETDLVCFLRAGDRIDAPALAALERAAAEGGILILFDLYYRRNGSVYPLLLPGVDLIHALNCDYFRSRFAVRSRLAAAAVRSTGQPGGHAAALRILSGLTLGRNYGALAHVPLPLVEVPDQGEAIIAERLALLDPATPVAYLPSGQDPAPAAGTGVSIIISTKDKGRLTDLLVRQILALGDLVEDVVIVSNNTANGVARANLARLADHPKVTLVRHDHPYNFSIQSNLGARRAKGETLLFLNDDIVPVTTDWLEELLAPFTNPEVAVAGPLLLYPDERVQHGGMFLGYNGIAGHTLRYASLPEEDYLFMASAPREVSAVTGAALLIRRGVFEDLNGFDPQLATYLQDVDLCLRVVETGHRVVFTPRPVLLHMESVSFHGMLKDTAFQEQRRLECRHFTDRWGARVARDRHHNPCFAPNDETLQTLR